MIKTFRKSITSVTDVKTVEDILIYPNGIRFWIADSLDYIENKEMDTWARKLVITNLCEGFYEMYRLSIQKGRVPGKGCLIHIHDYPKYIFEIFKRDDLLQLNPEIINLKPKFNKLMLNKTIHNFETNKVILNRSVCHFNKERLKKVPIKEIFDYSYPVDKMVDLIANKWKVKYVGVDFDQTLITMHTKNKPFDPLWVSKKRRHEYVVNLVKILLVYGIEVAVITHCSKQVKNIELFTEFVFGVKLDVFTINHRSSKYTLLKDAFSRVKVYNSAKFYKDPHKWDGYIDFNSVSYYRDDTAYKGIDGNCFHFERTVFDDSDYMLSSLETARCKRVLQTLLIDDSTKNLDDVKSHGIVHTLHVQMTRDKQPGEVGTVKVNVVPY